MRMVLILVAVLFFNSRAMAKNELPKIIRLSVPVLELPVPSIAVTESFPETGAKVAILYKMRENIIRRELSFIPKKKWMKWS